MGVAGFFDAITDRLGIAVIRSDGRVLNWDSQGWEVPDAKGLTPNQFKALIKPIPAGILRGNHFLEVPPPSTSVPGIFVAVLRLSADAVPIEQVDIYPYYTLTSAFGPTGGFSR
jgi:hypothetical protein